MSGPLVGLVIEHGPQDRAAWACLMVIAERLHGPQDSWDSTTEDLAALARVSPATAKRGVALLVAEGWVHRKPGQYRGHSSTYWFGWDAFPPGEVEKFRKSPHPKGVMVTPSTESKGGHGDPLKERKGVMVTAKGVMVTQHTVTVKTSSSPPADPPLPEVVAVNADDDELDDTLRKAMDGLPVGPKAPVARSDVTAALEAGWTASALNTHLKGHLLGSNIRSGPAVIYAALKALPPPPTPKVRVPSWCGECDQGTRWVKDSQGNTRNCPRCHPQTVREGTP